MSNQDILDTLEGTEIAVVGMAGRFPGAADVEQFWQNVRDGKEALTSYSDDELRQAGVSQSLLRNPHYVKAGMPLDEMEMFDAPFFGFGPRDAAIMDPQHRHFLEVTWEALEHAGYDPARFDGLIGVYGGSGHNAYLPYNLLTNPELLNSVGFFLLRHTGNDKDFLTTRVSYVFDLKGPSVNVQTACSTSLVAIHMASQSLLSGECDMALAGGVTIEMPHRQGYLYQEGEILSPDGHCRAFDHRSKGTVFGSGVGAVVLKRLGDAIVDGDTVHAVVLGSAINNDGSGKVNYLAPSVDGQAAAIAEALALANVDVETIDYVETHGTGTPIGDPIEVSALTQAFRATTDKKSFCGIGSVKTNIGHLDTAAGIASFIKVVQAMKHGQLPPSLNFEQPNPMLDIENSPFFVNDRLQSWRKDGFPRRAGVSSLGVGGTNAHLILEEAPQLEPSGGSRPWQLLLLSARTPTALENASDNLAAHLQQNPDVKLADVAYTLQVGRRGFGHRRALVVRDAADAVTVLEENDRQRINTANPGEAEPSVVFMFPGGGAQYPNMGRGLYETEPVYRETVDECLELVRPYLDTDLRPLLFPDPGDVEDAAQTLQQRPSLSLPALFTTSYALARQWLAWGVEPAALTGHSLGEYVAACLAGVFSLEDALAVVAWRGELFESLPEGAMLSVPLSEEDLTPYLNDALDIAAINSSTLCAVSGPVAAIEDLGQRLAADEVEARRIKIDVAAHSQMLQPILDEFGSRLQRIDFHPPQRPFICNVTGAWADPAEVTQPDYWVRHLRHTVRFADGISQLLVEDDRVFLEVGPGKTLGTLTRMHAERKRSHTILTSIRHPKEGVDDLQFLLNTLGQMWNAGVAPDWEQFYAGEVRYRIPLPTYPFDHQRYWIEPGERFFAAETAPPPLVKLPELADWFYRPVWRPASVAPADAVEPGAWLVFRDALGVGDLVGATLRREGHQVIDVEVGERFRRIDDRTYAINPRARADYDTLTADLASRDLLPNQVAHLWLLNTAEPGERRMRSYYRNQDFGFYSLFFLAQTLGEADLPDRLQITVFSNGMQQVESETVPYPEKATVLGPVMVIPKELPHVTCRAVDLTLPSMRGDQLARGDDEAVARQVLSELLADVDEKSEEMAVAYRQGRRYVRDYEPSPLPEPEGERPSRLRPGGVYLISGGMGGIGLVMARHLAKVAGARLALLNRSPLPPRAEWDAWLAEHGPYDKTSRRIQGVRELEASGGELLLLSADVTDREQLETAVAQARDHFGQINGVIHAAGVLDDAPLQLKKPQDVDRVLAPKVRGALLLEEALASDTLDFFILFSSTSTALGAAGQVDYVAANAFLNAFATSKAAADTFTVAINWGVWREVGMAMEAAAEMGLVERPSIGGEAPHPLLDHRVAAQDGTVIYATDYSTDTHWLLDQHRIKGGEALIPGTGYLEIAKAAVSGGVFNGPIQIEELFFLAPLAVRAHEKKEVRVTLKENGSGYELAVTSKVGGEGKRGWREHARAQVAQIPADLPPPQPVDEIIARCDKDQVEYGLMEQETRQEQLYLDFGPRWKTLRRIHFGDDEAIALLALPEQFTSDLEAYTLHPALMDLATSFALPLIPGYSNSDDFYVPLSYQKVKIYEAVPRRIYSHARYQDDGSAEVPAFDLTIMDESGRVCVDIQGFTLKRVDYQTMMAQSHQVAADDTGPETAVSEDGPSLLELGLTEGIGPEEGMAALDRILDDGAPPHLIVSSLDLQALIAAMRPDESDDAFGIKLARPELESSYAAPRNDVERKLVEIWSSLLGIDEIGIHDDFFELGGHSLIAVRLFTKVKKLYGVDLALATLFQAPTIAQFTELLAAHGVTIGDSGDGPGANGTGTAVVSSPPSTGITTEWSALVPVQAKGHKPPFFCVHGGYGNVLIFYDLARYLGQDQPFYGLQAPGVDGRRRALRSIEEMAQLYVDELLVFQPEGPYYLGGFSMGGQVAFDMAQRLRRAGREVALLVLFDTYNPWRIAQPEQSDNLQEKAERHRTELEQRPLQEKVQYLWDKVEWRAEWLQKKVRSKALNTACHLYIDSGRVLPQSLRDPYMWEATLQATNSYVPDVYPGEVTLFRASESLAWNPIDGPTSWRNVAGDGLNVHLIEGTHNIVKEPYVADLARQFRSVLEEAQRDDRG